MYIRYIRWGLYVPTCSRTWLVSLEQFGYKEFVKLRKIYRYLRDRKARLRKKTTTIVIRRSHWSIWSSNQNRSCSSRALVRLWWGKCLSLALCVGDGDARALAQFFRSGLLKRTSRQWKKRQEKGELRIYACFSVQTKKERKRERKENVQESRNAYWPSRIAVVNFSFIISFDE